VAAPDAFDTESLLHELTVDQVELEAQNENLRQAQQQAEEAQQHYALLFQDAPVAYVVVDAKGTIRDINRQGERLIGLPASKLRGTPLLFYLSPDSLDVFTKHLEASLSANERQRAEIVLVDEGAPRCPRRERLPSCPRKHARPQRPHRHHRAQAS